MSDLPFEFADFANLCHQYDEHLLELTRHHLSISYARHARQESTPGSWTGIAQQAEQLAVLARRIAYRIAQDSHREWCGVLPEQYRRQHIGSEAVGSLLSEAKYVEAAEAILSDERYRYSDLALRAELVIGSFRTLKEQAAHYPARETSR